MPLLGTMTILTRQVSLATVTAGPDGGLVQQHTACAIGAESRPSFATTSFPAGFVRALPTKTYPIRLEEVDGAWRFTADTGPLAIGYHPDLAGGTLPTEEDDPAVYDWDQDGEPGATVTVKALLFGEVEVYVVQSSRGRLEGAVREVAADRATAIGGAFVLDGFEQHTIGASQRLFHTTPHATFDPSGSTFEMRRVPEGSTCADVLP